MDERLAIEGGNPVREGPPVVFHRAQYGYEELKALIDVLQSGVLCRVHSGATQAKELEREFAEWLGVKHAVAFNSGATAQHASLAAIDIGPGDEVIVPPLTYISTAYTVLLQCAIPVFADVDPGTYNIDPDEIKKKVTKRTKAIVPVHWFGHPAEMDGVLEIAREYDLKVIEDCAHAFGTEYKGKKAGTIGDIACWSLHASKIITALGEGGLLTTNDDQLAEKARTVMDSGKRYAPLEGSFLNTYRVASLGNNYRMTEAQAAFARAQLEKLPEFHARRRECAEYMDAQLEDLNGVIRQETKPDVRLSYAYYVVRFDSEKFTKPLLDISAAINAEGVQSRVGFALEELSHVHPLFTDSVGRGTVDCPWRCPHYEGEVTYGWGTLPKAEKLAHEILALPLHPGLSRDALDDVATAVKKVAKVYHI